MAKYSLKNRFDDEKFEELAKISHNLRYYSKIWKDHFGAYNRTRKDYWENIMDNWLKENVNYGENDLNDENLPDNLTWATNTTRKVG